MKKYFPLSLVFFLLANLLSANSFPFPFSSGDYDGYNLMSSQNNGSIFGTLRDKDTNLPIPGADVTITNSATGDIVYTGTTNQHGEFEFSNAESGVNYSVEFYREHFYTVTMDNIQLHFIGFKNVDAFAALKTTANGGIGGTVITDDQLLAKGVDIKIYPIGGTGNYNTTTDDNGTFFAADIPQGEYNVWTSKDDSQLTNSIEITVNEMLKWHIFEDVPLPASTGQGSIILQVNSEDGNPVQNAKVTVPDVGTKFSDSDGKVNIDNVPDGTYTVTASSSDHYSDVKTLTVSGGTPANGTLTLNPAEENKAEVTGNVRDVSSNSPVEGVNVAINFQEQAFTTTTDANGDFKITDVPAVGSYTANYSKTGYHTTVQKRGIETTSGSTSFKDVLLANKVEGHGAICIKVQSKRAQENISNILIQGYNPVMGFTGTVYADADIRYLEGEIIITKIPVNAHLLLLCLQDGTIVRLHFNVEECHMEEFFLNDSMIITDSSSKICGKAKDQQTGNSTGGIKLTSVWGVSSLLKTNEETTLTNLRGEFVIDNLTPETQYMLNISTDEINTTQILINSSEENNTIYNEILTAVSSTGKGAVAGIIEGLKLDQVATVQISSGTSTTTVDDNSYLINDIDPGTYTLTAIFGGVEKQADVTIESGITKQINFEFYAEALTSVERIDDIIPSSFALFQNYPNPFNPTTTIKYHISETANTTLIIYDTLGRKVTTLVNEIQSPGIYKVNFDAAALTSGIYFYKLDAGAFQHTSKMILLK